MQEYIKVRGAKEHNLQNVNVDIPKNQLVVITGLSGSGKSSLAFDTIYAEGQRRYIESLSAYARQFLNLTPKPNFDSITGLSPAIAIEQKTTFRNPRSTVGTVTEIYDYVRLLYARIGIPYSPATGLPIKSQSISEMVDIIKNLPWQTKLYILAPIIRGQKGEFRREILNAQKQGFQRVIVDGELYDIEGIDKLDKNKKHNIEVVVDRIVVDDSLGNRVADSLEVALNLAEGIVYLEIINLPTDSQVNELVEGQRIVLSQKYSCPISNFQIEEIEPRIFSFNSPFGACQKCGGVGKEMFFDPALIVPDDSLSIQQGAIAPWKDKVLSKTFSNVLNTLAKHYLFSLDTPFRELPSQVQQLLFYGSGEELIKFQYYNNSNLQTTDQSFGGIIPSLVIKYNRTDMPWLRTELSKYQTEHKCSQCKGYRLKMESLCVKIDQFNIGEVADMNVAQAQRWFEELNSKLNNRQLLIAERILKEINQRLRFLINVGLEYLNLSRESGTLSGGESQRIRLASQIGSGLSGVLYVLDEPSIGLHQRDNSKLISTLKDLRDLGNSVLVVEHDEETMHEADHIIDIGPSAGIHGGRVIAQGSMEDIKNSVESITGQYLSGKKFISVPNCTRRGRSNHIITLVNASSNNLKNVNITINLGTFTVVTGVSGSGKSTLIINTLYKAILKHLEPSSKTYPGKFESITGLEKIDKIIEINQLPIGRTPRSNPVTYTGTFMHIRDWFAGLPESRARGYKIGRFSFNVKGGRCETCQGDGLIKIEMHFLPDVYIKCDACNGRRYNRETLEVKYKGNSIADVLEMTVEDAIHFFDAMTTIKENLLTLNEVGLGYIKLGQSATTLSGGEAQRIKLAKELAKKSTGKTLYILDEPTTGLHIDDISRLLKVLHKLVDLGNTVLVIEHNMDVIKTADYIIDVGPEGGGRGGEIVIAGTPAEVIACKKSFTGQYLKRYMS